MKLNLFFSGLFVFTVLHLSKAGPLRLQKRAAFYIANETACVVDNIVYSNGDPIPTDDPCESCKCRPPGFACVLKDCLVKPGCKAVRRVGQCCPEYVCGCEHNGRMYRDGEEIRDPKNPCYECHCQGSSIACAFVDCFFRDDCDSIYLPGKCCPEYKNCTRDISENNQFFGGNVLPSVNLLPVLNDESVLPGDIPTTIQTPEVSEEPADPTQPPSPSNSNEEILLTVTDESSKVPEEPQTIGSEILTTEDSNLDPKIEEKSSGEEKSSEEEKTEDSLPLEDDSEEEKAVEVNEAPKVVFNSDTEIKKEDNKDLPKENIEPTQSSVEKIVEVKPQTTIPDEIVEAESEAEVTEKSSDDSISTKTEEGEKQTKNSAAENGKSLKLTDDQSKDAEKKEEIKVDESEKQDEKVETDTETKTVSVSEGQSVPEESSSTESTPESEDSKASSLSSNEKIKSESAETVTIVVHVREKAKPTTEKDLINEEITQESVTSVTQESLLKSNDLQNLETSEKTTEAEIVSTGKNFEIFPSSTEVSKDESITNSPSTEQFEGRSDESETTTSNPVQNLTNEDLKKDESSSVAPTTQKIEEVTEVSKEARANEEIIEEPKADEPTVTVIRINPSSPITIEIITDTSATPKIEEQTTKESENKEATEEPTQDEKSEVKDESIPEEKLKEISPEVREEEPKTENIEETTEKKDEGFTTVEKIEVTTLNTDVKAEERAQDSDTEEKVTETAAVIEKENKPEATTNSEITENEKSKSEDTTNSPITELTNEPKQTEAPSDKE